MEKNILVLSGDGSGPEIMKEGVKDLEAIAEKYGHKFDLIYAPFGAQAYYEHGATFPEDTKKKCLDVDSIAKGPVGLAKKDMVKMQQAGVQLELETVLGIRAILDTYAGFRPVVLPIEFAEFSPLKKEVLGNGINIMMVREMVGGNYFGSKVEPKNVDWKYAIDEGKYTAEQVERIAHVAFKEAQKIGSKLTSVSKPNVMAEGRLWDKVVGDVAEQYKDVPVDYGIVDAVAYKLCIDPSQYNGVMLFENMQGDIITDQAGGILGSLGLMPSAVINPETGRGYYEPSHGSAPDIAGQNKANPYSMIGSFAFMLEKAFGLEEEAKDLWGSLTKVFAAGYRTGELARKNTQREMILSTSQFGDKVKEYILAK